MQVYMSRLEAVVAAFFGLCVLDWSLELCLIQLLRRRHYEMWIAAGSPSASFCGLLHNSFNARNYVMTRADRCRHDWLLSTYCWFFLVFNALFLAYMAFTAVLILIAGVRFLFRV